MVNPAEAGGHVEVRRIRRRNEGTFAFYSRNPSEFGARMGSPAEIEV
jgi:hypothetical protein